MIVTVNVTAEMGDPLRMAGLPQAWPEICMVAQALRPLILDNYRVSSGYGQAYAEDENGDLIGFGLPDEESERISTYDNDIQVPAHSFQIDIPERFLREEIVRAATTTTRERS